MSKRHSRAGDVFRILKGKKRGMIESDRSDLKDFSLMKKKFSLKPKKKC